MDLVLISREDVSRFEVDVLFKIIAVAYEQLPTFVTESETVPSEIINNVW